MPAHAQQERHPFWKDVSSSTSFEVSERAPATEGSLFDSSPYRLFREYQKQYDATFKFNRKVKGKALYLSHLQEKCDLASRAKLYLSSSTEELLPSPLSAFIDKVRDIAQREGIASLEIPGQMDLFISQLKDEMKSVQQERKEVQNIVDQLMAFLKEDTDRVRNIARNL